MRRLFVVGTVCFVVLIAWLLYINYDMIHFENEHSDVPVTQQESNNSLNKGTVQNRNTNEPIENAETSIQSTDSVESIPSVNEPITDKDDTYSVGNPVVQQQAPTDTRLSPETIKFYKAYRSLDKEMTKYNSEQLVPLQKKFSLYEERRVEINNQLVNGNHDRATINVLREELNEIIAWCEENSSTQFELQDKVREIDERQIANIKEFGYSSFDEFWTAHWKTYEVWVSEQTSQ